MASKLDGESVLYWLACECQDLFNQLQETFQTAKAKATTIELCAELQQRFSIWAAYFGVFAQGSQCLDTRLRNTPDLQDLVVRLLDILRCSLQQYKDEINSQGQGHQTLISVDETRPKASPTHSEYLTEINHTLAQLNRLGVAIRRSSQDKIDIRAKKFTAGLDLTLFNTFCINAIQTLYPGVHRSLQDYLKESMITRYVKILHHDSRYAKLKAPREPNRGLLPISEIPNNELQTAVPIIQPTMTIPVTANTQRSHAAPSGSDLSSVNIQRTGSRCRPPDETSTKFHKIPSVQVTQGNYPKLPLVNGDTNIFTCECCSEPLDKNILSEIEWRYVTFIL